MKAKACGTKPPADPQRIMTVYLKVCLLQTVNAIEANWTYSACMID